MPNEPRPVPRPLLATPEARQLARDIEVLEGELEIDRTYLSEREKTLDGMRARLVAMRAGVVVTAGEAAS